MEFQLLLKKIKNELSPEEEVVFNRWYRASGKHRSYYAKICSNYSKQKEPVKTDEAWQLINSKLNRNHRNYYWQIAIAASVIGIIALAVFFQKTTNPNNPSTDTQPISSITEPSIPSPPPALIQIGKHKAVLTLGNGNEVVLTNKIYETSHTKSNGSQLIYESLNAQPPSENIVYNYLTIPRGGEYFVKLSDGTKVWLNSDSKIKYPVRFTGKSRKIELLYGEAYFDVSPSTLHQGANFVVQTNHQIVEVFGTQFNIKAYKEDPFIATTLVEGRVTLTNSLTRQKEKMVPNQQVKLNTETNKLSIYKVNPENIICWKDGFFKFKNKSLEEIMTVLSRWYAIEATFKNEGLKTKEFNGVFRKQQQIESILKSIEQTQEAAFQIEGEKIIIKNYKK